MSDIKKLLETANRKCEMNWKVYAFNPEKDNELADESPVFQCIKKAAEYKREVVEKHPDYIVEIVAESKQKNEDVIPAVHDSLIIRYKDKHDKADFDAIVKMLKELLKKASFITFSDIREEFEGWRYSKDDIDKIIVAIGGKPESSQKNEDDKTVVTKANFANYKEQIKAVIKDLYFDASYRPKVLDLIEKAINAGGVEKIELLKDNSGKVNYFYVHTKRGGTYDVGDMSYFIRTGEKLESAQKNEGVHFGQPNVDKCYSELMDISFQEMKKRNGKELSDKEFEAFRPMLLKKYPKEVVDYCYMKANESAQKNEGKTIDDIPTRDLGKCLKEYRAKVGNNKVLQNSLAAIADEFQRCFNLASKPSIIQVGNILDNMPKEYVESAQINETRGYKVLVELGVPDNMNNRDIEDEVERLLRTSNKINVVMDVTAERK